MPGSSNYTGLKKTKKTTTSEKLAKAEVKAASFEAERAKFSKQRAERKARMKKDYPNFNEDGTYKRGKIKKK